MTIATIAPGRFELVRVVRRTIISLRPNLMNIVALAVLFIALPSAIYDVLSFSNLIVLPFPENVSIGLAFICRIPVFLLMTAFNAAVIGNTVGGGHRESVMKMAKDSLPFALPVLGLWILMCLGVTVGLILLIVPGLILLTMWSVAAPALIVEKAGVFDAFRRSRALSKGFRWSIFTLTLIEIVTFISIDPDLKGAGTFTFHVIESLLFALTSAITSTIGASLSASIYSELCLIKEGVTPSELVQVFD